VCGNKNLTTYVANGTYLKKHMATTNYQTVHNFSNGNIANDHDWRSKALWLMAPYHVRKMLHFYCLCVIRSVICHFINI